MANRSLETRMRRALVILGSSEGNRRALSYAPGVLVGLYLALNHACLLDGVRLSKASRVVFAHTSPVWIGHVGSVDAGAAARAAAELMPVIDAAEAQP